MFSIQQLKYHQDKVKIDIKKTLALKLKLEVMIAEHDQILTDNKAKLADCLIVLQSLESLKI